MYKTAYLHSTHPAKKQQVHPRVTMGETVAKEKPMRKVLQRDPTSAA